MGQAPPRRQESAPASPPIGHRVSAALTSHELGDGRATLGEPQPYDERQRCLMPSSACLCHHLEPTSKHTYCSSMAIYSQLCTERSSGHVFSLKRLLQNDTSFRRIGLCRPRHIHLAAAICPSCNLLSIDHGSCFVLCSHFVRRPYLVGILRQNKSESTVGECVELSSRNCLSTITTRVLVSRRISKLSARVILP